MRKANGQPFVELSRARIVGVTMPFTTGGGVAHFTNSVTPSAASPPSGTMKSVPFGSRASGPSVSVAEAPLPCATWISLDPVP